VRDDDLSRLLVGKRWVKKRDSRERIREDKRQERKKMDGCECLEV